MTDLPADHNDPSAEPKAQPGLEYRWNSAWGWALFPRTEKAPKPKRRKRRGESTEQLVAAILQQLR